MTTTASTNKLSEAHELSAVLSYSGERLLAIAGAIQGMWICDRLPLDQQLRHVEDAINRAKSALEEYRRHA